MITTAILYVYLGILNLALVLLPVADPLPASVGGAVEAVQGAIDLMGWILPLDTLLTAFGLALSLEIIIFSVRWSVWLYNKIRGSG